MSANNIELWHTKGLSLRSVETTSISVKTSNPPTNLLAQKMHIKVQVAQLYWNESELYQNPFISTIQPCNITFQIRYVFHQDVYTTDR